MKTPEEILREKFVGSIDLLFEPMKEYAKQWVEEAIKGTGVSSNNLITYYHLAIDAQ